MRAKAICAIVIGVWGCDQLRPTGVGVHIQKPSPSNAQVGLTSAPNWVLQVPAAAPSARGFHAMSSNCGIAGAPVLFGGRTGTSYLSDTWLWSRGAWVQQTPTQSPSARGGHALVSNGRPNEGILFGGYDGQYPQLRLLNDTWMWNGANWAQVTPVHSPEPRGDHAMAFDPVRGEVVLFGGYDGTYRRDTWIWDGSDWIQKNPSNMPTAGVGARMAFDAIRGAVLLFGGYDGAVYSNITWMWDGIDWTSVGTATTPPPRAEHAMASDCGRGQVVVFGGYGDGGSSVRSDTWAWDGTDWSSANPQSSPTARIAAVLGFDPVEAELVLFGGDDSGGGGTVYRNDTWVWSHSPPQTLLQLPSGGAISTLFGETGSVGEPDERFVGSDSLLHPALGGKWHHGTDFAASSRYWDKSTKTIRNSGSIFAAGAGEVIFVGAEKLRGRDHGTVVMLHHPDIHGPSGYPYVYTFYSHMGNKRNSAQSLVASGVAPGLSVTAGQFIGCQGNDGSTVATNPSDPAGGTHLHFEIRVSRVLVAPGQYQAGARLSVDSEFILTSPDLLMTANIVAPTFPGSRTPPATSAPTVSCTL